MIIQTFGSKLVHRYLTPNHLVRRAVEKHLQQASAEKAQTDQAEIVKPTKKKEVNAVTPIQATGSSSSYQHEPNPTPQSLFRLHQQHEALELELFSSMGDNEDMR